MIPDIRIYPRFKKPPFTLPLSAFICPVRAVCANLSHLLQCDNVLCWQKAHHLRFCKASGVFTHYARTSYLILKRRAGKIVNSQPTCFANDRKLLISTVFWRKKKSTSWIYYEDTFSLERNWNPRRIESIPRGIGIESNYWKNRFAQP